MDIVAELKDAYSFLGDPLHRKAYEEIERLRENKAELVEALIDMRNHVNERDWDADVSNEAKATFAKATGN